MTYKTKHPNDHIRLWFNHYADTCMVELLRLDYGAVVINRGDGGRWRKCGHIAIVRRDLPGASGAIYELFLGESQRKALQWLEDWRGQAAPLPAEVEP